MTHIREQHSQRPPRLVIVLLAIFVIGLLLELGAAFAMAGLSTDRSGTSGSPHSDTSNASPVAP